MYIEIMFDKRYELFGESVFTSFRSYEGSVPYLEEHLKRLWRHTCHAFHLSIKYELFEKVILSKIQIEKKIKENLNHYFRITVFSQEKSDLSLSTFNLDQFDTHLKIKPIEQTTREEISLQMQATPFTSHYPNFKTGNYFPHLYYRRQAILDGFSDVLFINDKENILEASTSSIIFEFKNNYIIPTADGIFEGITILAFKDFCKKENICYSEVEVHKNDIEQFSGAFLLNSVKGYCKVKKINDIFFKSDDHDLVSFIEFLKESK